jgi:hypothetical protein
MKRGAVLLVLVVVVLLAACGGNDDNAVDTSAVPSSATNGEQIVIRTRMVIAAAPGAEPIATGDVLAGSTLEGSPFCAGGTIRDSHAKPDSAVERYGLIDRTITCADGSVRMGFTPEQPDGLDQTGSWRLAGGTGAYEGLGGSGEMTIRYDPDDDSVGRETLTGTVRRSAP